MFSGRLVCGHMVIGHFVCGHKYQSYLLGNLRTLPSEMAKPLELVRILSDTKDVTLFRQGYTVIKSDICDKPKTLIMQLSFQPSRRGLGLLRHSETVILKKGLLASGYIAGALRALITRTSSQ